MISRDKISPALLKDIEDYLGITWEDEVTDRKIRNLIARGMVYLTDKLGHTEAKPLDFEADTEERTLLFEYVRYARDAATDVFENNYMSLILAAQNNRRVSAYAENALQTEE